MQTSHYEYIAALLTYSPSLIFLLYELWIYRKHSETSPHYHTPQPNVLATCAAEICGVRVHLAFHYQDPSSPLAHLIHFLAFSYTASFRLTIMAESKLDYSEPDYVKQQDKSKVPYYRPDLTDRISPEVSFDLCPHDQMSSDMST